MLMKEKIFAIMFFLILSSLVRATVICSECEVGKCVCEVIDCDSGIVDIFEDGCSTTPDMEMTFKNSFEWKPEREGTYYVLVLCDDGQTPGCEEIKVEEKQETSTTIRKTTTTRPKGYEEEEEMEGGADVVTPLLFLLLVILIAIGVFYMYTKRRGRTTWEKLYKKWGR